MVETGASIEQELLMLYELSLSIGQDMDPQVNAQNFLSALVTKRTVDRRLGLVARASRRTRPRPAWDAAGRHPAPARAGQCACRPRTRLSACSPPATTRWSASRTLAHFADVDFVDGPGSWQLLGRLPVRAAAGSCS
jgi:hypothetical protein